MPLSFPLQDIALLPARAGVEVRHSPVHGLGVFAVRHLPAGWEVGPYEGRRYSAAQAAQRRWNQALTYVFGLSDGSLIDGSEGGNFTQHINHACEPNCAAYEVEDEDGELGICIETLREIEAGEELFLDYSLDVATGDADAFRCCCGTPECRGSMLAPDADPPR